MKKISIKLRASELQSLVSFMESSVLGADATDKLEFILKSLLQKFYVKIKTRSLIIDRQKIRISVDAETAVAFIEYYSGYPSPCYTHASNVVLKLISHFDQQTAQFISA